MARLTLLVLAALVAGGRPLAAKQPDERPTHRVPRVEGVIRVDAVLDETLWQQALVLEPRLEVRPGENIPAPVRTEVLIAYGAEALYVAFKAYDPHPEMIRARLSDRDNTFDDDWVGIVLDTFNDQRRWVDLVVNPLGVQADLTESGEGEDLAWDTIWASAGRITPEGYVVEIAVPFSSLRFQRAPGDQVWGFDALRSWPRDVDHRIGLFPRDRSNNCYMCQAHRLIGFAGASPGRNVELDPTFAATVTQEREAFPDGPMVQRDRKRDLGLTGAWGVTPNLTLGGAINPDFSQVEADAAQLDINTQFALFYPEKRPFFLEGADLFSTRLNVVHTRTVADPDWGIKLTGKEGANAVGVFVARDNITNLLLPGSEWSEATSLDRPVDAAALRYRRDVGESSTLGVLATDREGGGYFNRVAGIDGVLRVTAKDKIRFQALGSRTAYDGEVPEDFGAPDDTFGGSAIDFLYSHDTRSLDWYAAYKKVTRGFRADLGYMPQVGYDYLDLGWGYTWNHAPGYWYNSLNVGSGYEEKRNQQGGMLHRAYTLWASYQGPYQQHSSFNAFVGRRSYRGAEFTDRHFSGCYGIRPVADLWLHLYWEAGDSVDYANARPGKVLTLGPTIDYRLGRHVSATFNHSHQRLDVNGERLYRADVSELRLVYQLNHRAFVRAIVQRYDYRRNTGMYKAAIDPQEQHLFSQLLFSYKVNPRTVLFLGYSDNYRGTSEVSLTQANRTLFFKLGYAWVL